MKKTIAILIAALMLLSMIPVSAFAADEPACKDTEHTKENCEYEEYKKVPSECGEWGYVIYQCKACGDFFAADFEKIPGNHSYKLVAEAVAPTCTAAGKLALYQCEKCGDVDDDRNGDPVKALGHDWKKVGQDGDCVTGGFIYEECAICGEKKQTPIAGTGLGHIYGEYPVGTIKAPTCSEEGSATFECTVCHTTKTLPIKKIDHEIVEDKAVAPTCTDTGLTAGEHCVNCDYKVEQKVVDALGHAWGADFDVVPATCETPYTAKHTCATCKVTETVTGKANGHTYGDKPDDIIPATCTTYGYEISFCTVCGLKKEDNVIPPLGHTEWDDKTSVITNFVAETCEVNGTVSWNCGRCGVAQGPKAIDEIAGHALETKTVDPTCHHVGYTFSYCTNKDCCTYASISTTTKDNVEFDVTVDGKPVCFKELTVVGTELNPENHEYEELPTNPATCTDPGSKVKYCPWCEVQTYAVIDPLGHDYTVLVGVKTPATCTDDRVDTYKCVRCDATQDVTVPETALGHAEQVVAKVDPTCTDKGYTEYTKCTECDWTDGRGKEIAATGHSYTGVVTDPTCKAAGYTTYTCSACSDSYTVDGEKYVYDPVFEYDSFADALKVHPELDENTRAELREGNCYLKSLVTYTCGYCEKKIHVVSDQSTGDHIWEVLEAKKNPTCTDDGAEIKYHCTRLGCNETKGGEKINKLGHDWKASECGNVGRKCVRAGCGLDEGYVAHNSGWMYTVTEKCETIGFKFYGCLNECGTVAEEYLYDYKAPTGHTLVDSAKVDSTCSVPGHTAGKDCADCDYTTTTPLPLAPHTNEKGEALEDSCLNVVKGTRECQWCHATIGQSHKEFFEVKIDSDCDSDGYILEVCSAGCGYEEVTDIIPMKTEPTWGTWVETKPASFTEEGSETRTCTVCNGKVEGHKETRAIPAVPGIELIMSADNADYAGAGFTDSSLVALTIKVDSVKLDVWGMKFDVNYDANMQFVRAEFAADNKFTANQVAVDNEGYVSVAAFAPNNDAKQTENVTIEGEMGFVTLYFRVINGEFIGTSTDSTFSIAGTSAIDTEYGKKAVTAEALTLEIFALMDYNRDGDVTLEDLLAGNQILTEELVVDKKNVVYDVALDTDKDGELTAADLLNVLDFITGAKSYDDVHGYLPEA